MCIDLFQLYRCILLSRLLDASAVPVGVSLDLTLVLEYIDQDLSTYLSKAPASGLSRDCIKVWVTIWYCFAVKAHSLR